MKACMVVVNKAPMDGTGDPGARCCGDKSQYI